MRPRVLLFQPPIYDFAAFDLFFKPYGLLRIGKWLQFAGFEVSYLNALDPTDSVSIQSFGEVKRRANGTGKFFRQPAELPAGLPNIPRQYSRYGICRSVIAEAITASAPHIVFITTGMTYWYEGVVEAVAAVREHAPASKVVLGGVYASLMSEHALRVTGADAVVTGDGEGQMRTLLGSYGFPVPSGPVPTFPLLLQDAWKGNAGAIRLNTGCPLSCDYCASACISPTFKEGDPEQGFEFLSDLEETFGISHVAFYDDALLMRKEQVLFPFLRRVIVDRREWKFYTPNAVHVRLIDRTAADLMYRAGFGEIRMGYESSLAEFHDLHDNKFTDDEFSTAVDALYGAGFTKRQLPVYILAGLPGQRREDVEHSVISASQSGVSVSIAEYSPVPGTPAWDQVVKESPFPLEEEPLLHNNSLHITAWEGLTRDDMHALKLMARATR